MDVVAIWKRARADLVVSMGPIAPDVFLWEHVSRVARNSDWILQLPEVQSQGADPIAVLAAALYHEAGWIVRYREGGLPREDILLGPAPDTAVPDAVQMLEDSLKELIPSPTLERAVAAVRLKSDRRTDMPEAQILAEADILEEFGPMFLWPVIRRGVFDGKGVQSVIDAWNRRRDYKFWTARLEDSFRYEATKQVAIARLSRLSEFIADLGAQQEAEDLRVSLTGNREPAGVSGHRAPAGRKTESPIR